MMASLLTLLATTIPAALASGGYEDDLVITPDGWLCIIICIVIVFFTSAKRT